jgi:MarR family transcriptional regulator, organic hydroperoxide resistance regulator
LNLHMLCGIVPTARNVCAGDTSECHVYRLTTSLPYKLNRVGVRLGELFSQELERLGLTLPMYRVLAALAEQDDQRLTDLSVVTSVEMTTLSRLTATLERRELLSRRRPSDNMRTILISLTSEGRALATQLAPRAEHYEREATRGLSTIEIATLKDVLDRIHNNLDALDPDRDAADAPTQVLTGATSSVRP